MSGSGPSSAQEPAPYTETDHTLHSQTTVADASVKEKRSVTLPTDSEPSAEDGTDGYPPQRPSRRGTRESNDGAPENPSLKRRLTELIQPEKPMGPEPTWKASGMAIVKASWLNVLLIFIPVGWALHFTSDNDTLIFVMTFLAIIPLAKLLGFGTEELSIRVGQTLGGLMNATLGNAVELIVAIIALIKCELQVVQASLIGSILSNLLLVLGMCFFAGGIKYSEQGFKSAAAQTNSGLLVLAVIAVLIPAGYNAAFDAQLTNAQEGPPVLKMSRGISILLLLIYGAYLIFTLFTHTHLYAEGNQEETVDPEGRPVWRNHRVLRAAPSVRRPRQLEEDVDEEEEGEQCQLNLWSAIVLLLAVTVLVGVTAEFLVSSINGLTDAHPEISTEWVGLILLPIVGNAAEHVTAVSVSVHDKIDLSMGVAVGSSIQISLFVIPFMVTLGWIIDKPLSLLFDPFESIVLFLTVILVNVTMQDGKSNWLEGWLLMLMYVAVAVSFWFYPTQGAAEQLFTC